MKILLISYGDIQYDGRLRELIKVSKMLGETIYFTSISMNYKKNDKNHIVCYNNSKWSYLFFLYHAVKLGVQNKDIDTLFIDNRRASLPGLIIYIIRKDIKIIQDVRELYLINETKSIVGKLVCFIEKKLYKYADVIICANSYRANIMKKIYALDTKPLVFENIRMLKYSNKKNIQKAKQKFDRLNRTHSLKIISTSGCSLARTNDKLIETISNLEKPCEMFLVGNSSQNDRKVINRLIKDKNIKGIHIINRLDEDELKYLIGCCDIGIVNYGHNDMNNKYCASGKIYEFIYEEKPIIATKNPPLEKLCQKYNIGIASDDYLNAINQMVDNYEFYKNNVIALKSKLDVEKNNIQLVKEIETLMNGIKK